MIVGVDDYLNMGDGFSDGCDGFQVLPGGNKYACLGMIQDVCDLRPDETGIDRYHHGADHVRREPRVRKLETILEEDCYFVSLLDPEGEKTVRDTIHRIEELPICFLLVFEDEKDLIRLSMNR